MSTLTTNLGLVKPALTDNADIAVINANMDLLDAAVASKETPTGSQAKATVAQTASEAYTDAKFPVSASGLTAGAATDTVVGNRTGDPTLVSPASTGTITQLFGWIMGRIKAITGTTNWYDAPPTTLAVANTHMTNTSNPHSVTAIQTGAIPMSAEGVANGVATLDPTGKVPSAQLPAMNYIPTSVEGAANGVATLDNNSHVPTVQLPNASTSAIGAVQLTANPSSGNPVVSSRLAFGNEVKVTGTTAQTIASYTPTTSGNFEVNASFRVVTGTTNVTVTVGWTDATGAQTNIQLNAQPCAVNTYAVPILALNAVSGSAITVQVTASVANQVYASCSIWGA